MKYLLFVFCAVTIAGCAPVASTPPPAATAASTLASSPTPTSAPTTAAPATATIVPSATPSRPAATATSAPASPSPTGPPALPPPTSGAAQAPGVPTPLSRAGWKTIASSKLHLAVEYPPDWTATEDSTGIAFAGPQGAMVKLSAINTGGLSPQEYQTQQSDLPNTRCTTSTNPNGISARICLDTISFSYTADIIVKPANAPAELLTLVTSVRKGGDVNVFYAMVSSVKPAP